MMEELKHGMLKASVEVIIKVNIPKHAFPCASYRAANNCVSSKESPSVRITDVYHASTGANLDQRISILQTWRLESTMLLFHRAEIHERSCGFSSGLAEIAIFGCLAAASRLKNSLNIPCSQLRRTCKITHVVTGS